MSAPLSKPNTSRAQEVWNTVRAGLRALTPLLHLLCYYPLLLAVVVLLLAFQWGGLMADYDAFHVLWNEQCTIGVLTGCGVAFLLGEVMFLVYLLDSEVAARSIASVTPGSPPQGQYAFSWGFLMFIALLPAFVCPDQFRLHNVRGNEVLSEVHADASDHAWWARVWLPLGAVTAAVLKTAFWLRLRARKYVAWSFALWGVGFLGVGYVVMVALHATKVDRDFSFLSASVSALILLCFLAGLFWLLTSWASKRVCWFYPSLLVLVAVPLIIPACQTEYQLPHMDDAHSSESYYRHRTPLTHYQATVHPEQSLRTQNEAKLLSDTDVLQKWHERMVSLYGEPQPVVVVTVSGGASASALYTADVLFTLEEQFPGFSDRVRIISGASGGMLGAAYFVTQLLPGGILENVRQNEIFVSYLRAADNAHQNPNNAEAKARVLAASEAYTKYMHNEVRPAFFRGLEQDFLSPLVQKWIHLDAPLAFVHRPTSNDRGAALEAAWSRHLQGSLDIPFRDLKTHELTGTIPSLIFTPMLIEDGRQLIISNLDLDYMVDAGSVHSQNLGAGAAVGAVAIAAGPQASTQGSQSSHMAVEFFRLFPHAEQFRLSTAVRMNASFPYLSPSAALPTDPVRHVVDAGYYDNYGTTAATKWIARNAGWLSSKYADDKLAASKPPEVIMLRIRCFGYEEDSRRFVTGDEIRKFGQQTSRETESDADLLKAWEETPPPQPIRTEGGLFSLTAPVFSLFSAWHANMVYRADERVGAAAKLLELDAALKELHRRLNPMDQRVRSVRISPFIAECQVKPSLNWALRADTIARIHADVEQNLALAAMVVNSQNNRSPAPPGLVGAGVAAAPVSADAGVQVVEQQPAFKAAPPSARQGMESQARSVERFGRMKLPDLAVIEAERKKPR